MLSSHLPWMLHILRHLLISLPSSCWLSFQKYLLKIYVSGIKGLRRRVCSLPSRSCRLVGMTGKQRQKFQDKYVCVMFRQSPGQLVSGRLLQPLPPRPHPTPSPPTLHPLPAHTHRAAKYLTILRLQWVRFESLEAANRYSGLILEICS